MQKYTPGNRDILQSRSERSSRHIVILGCNPDDQFAEPFPRKMTKCKIRSTNQWSPQYISGEDPIEQKLLTM